MIEIDKYKNRLVELQITRSVEDSHIEADGVLCDLLEELGYTDLVEEYRAIEKWFC